MTRLLKNRILRTSSVLMLMEILPLKAQDLPPPQDPSSLLQELERIEKGASSFGERRRAEAISRIQSAVASPSSSLELYLQALDAVKYSDKHQEFLDWKQKNQEILRHSSEQNAAQLQLRYLLLGLQRSGDHDALSQVPETLSFLNSLAELHFLEKPQKTAPTKKGASPQPFPPNTVISEAADLLKQPVSEAPVVQWLRLEDMLPEKNYEKSPANFTGILDQNVKSPLREMKDARLPGVWDLQIAAETSAKSNDDTQTVEVFRNNRVPELVFGKIKDMVVIGRPNQAVAELMVLIRSYPNNPSVPDWIKTARQILAVSQIQASPTPRN